MANNDDTIYRKTIPGEVMNKVNNNHAEKKSAAWKPVTIGGFAGILMGAGSVFAADAYAANNEDAQQTDGKVEQQQQEVKVADANHDSQSFSDAFHAAREEVGPGGVFTWHGGIYNTYTKEEWDAMTNDQKDAFAQSVRPEVNVESIDETKITESAPDIETNDLAQESETETAKPDDDDVQILEAQHETTPTDNPDVDILGYGEVEGHAAVALDIDGDGQADVAVIDADDSGTVTDPDVVVDSSGQAVTVGDLEAMSGSGAESYAAENPDVAPDMPDFMSDANLDIIA